MELSHVFFNTVERGLSTCCTWKADVGSSPIIVKVIDVTDVKNHTFVSGLRSTCYLTSYIAYLDLTGNWTKFNLSANVFEVKSEGLVSVQSTIKVFHGVFFLSGV